MEDILLFLAGFLLGTIVMEWFVRWRLRKNVNIKRGEWIYSARKQ